MRNDFIKGMQGAFPIVMGYLPIGFAYGVLAVQKGLSVWDIFCMSLFVYAGSAQFISADLIAAGAASASIIFTIFLVNLRHMLMSASLSPYLKGIATPAQALIAHGITDETFAVEITQVRQEIMSGKYFAGLHITAQGSWIISTVLGGVLGNLIPDPGRWGMDFALSAMFIGLLVMQMKNKKELVVAFCSGSISLLLALNMKGNWNIIIATLVAATIGVSVEAWNKKLSLSLSE